MMQTRSAGVDWMSSVGGSATMARFRADFAAWDCAVSGRHAAAPSTSASAALRRLKDKESSMFDLLNMKVIFRMQRIGHPKSPNIG